MWGEFEALVSPRMSFLYSQGRGLKKVDSQKVMAEENNPPEQPLADEPGTSSPDGDGNASSAVDDALDGADAGEKSLVQKVEETTGRKYASEGEALKAIKDTFGYVGDVGGLIKGVMDERGITRPEAVQYVKDKMVSVPADTTPSPVAPPPVVDTSQFVPRSEFDEANYYNTEDGSVNKPHKGIIDAFKSKPEHAGKSIPDVIASDEELRNTLEKAKAHDEAEGSKSVLQSNPRLGVIKDKVSQSKEGMQKFKETGDPVHHEQASKDAVDSVIDTMQTPTEQ